MHSIKKTLKSSLMAALVLAATAAPTLAADPTSVTADVLLARPIGLIGTVAGAGAWIATSPFTFVTGSAKDSADVLFWTPANYTFKRGLGDDMS